MFASPCAFDNWPAVRTRILVGRDDRFFPAEFQRRVARERLGIDMESFVSRAYSGDATLNFVFDNFVMLRERGYYEAALMYAITSCKHR